MKVAIEILSTQAEPSTTNIHIMKNTMVSLVNEYSDRLINQYDFFFYYGGYSASTLGVAVNKEQDETYSNCWNLKISTEESIYTTFEKGVWALKYISGYDWYIRINISCYLNILLLDKVLSQFNEDTVYCNAINSYINDEKYYNDLYPRGDMMIFSKKTREGILKFTDKYFNCDTVSTNRLNIPHVDDTLFGLCFIDYFGAEYYKHLQMLKYNYIPDIDITNKTVSTICIGNRVKTNPPGIKYSGYSWEDNEYRRYDAIKMEILNDRFKQQSYNNVKLSDLLSNERPTLFITLTNRKIEDFYAYLKRKRGN